MANDIKTNDPFETNSTSLLKAGIAGTSFAAGVGIGIHRLLQDGVVSPRASAVEDTLLAVKSPSGSPARLSYSDHLVFMNGAREKGMFKNKGAEVARTSWVQAMQFVDPYAISKLPKTTSGIQNMPSSQIAEALTKLSTHEGSETRKVFSRFRRNFQALSGQQSMDIYTKVKNLSFDISTNLKKTPLAPHLESQIKGMASGKIFASEFFTRAGFSEEGLGMHKISFGVEGKRIEFNLPQTSNGILVEGSTMSSRRIAPSFGVIDPLTKDINRMSREQFFLTELQESIVSDIQGGRIKSQRQVKGAVNELYQRVFGSLESIPNVTPDIRTPAIQRYQDIRGQAIDLVIKKEHRVQSGTGYSKAFREVTQTEMAEAMEKHGLFAGTGGKGLSKGRVQTLDISQEKLFPSAVAWSRKPESSIRQFGLTENSRKSLETGRYATYRDYESSSLRNKPGTPHMKTIYIDPEKHANIMQEQLFMGEGEAIGRLGMKDLIEHQSIRTKHLSTVAGENIEEFASDIQKGKFRTGDVLGWDQSGEVITMQKNMKLLKAVKNNTKARGDFATLYFEDLRKLENNAKWFGDFKGLMRLTKESWFESSARKLTKNDQMLSNLDVIVSMDELKKDPSKFAKQVLTSMTESVRSRGALKQGTLASDLAMRPRHYAQILETSAQKSGAFSSEEFTRAAMKLAGELDFSQTEFGSAFGAVPTVLGQKTTSKLISETVGDVPGYLESISHGLAGGIAQVSYGGPEEFRGAGKIGSIEPRAFEILRGSGFHGPIGPALSKEFTERMVATDKEALDVHRALTKTLSSMEGISKPKTGEEVFKVAQEFKDPRFKENFQGFIKKGGGWLDPGSGMHSIYVPGPETTLKMRPYQTAGGIEATGSLANIYHQLAEASGKMYTDVDPYDVGDVKKEFTSIAKDIHKHQAPAGKGMGSYLRGKVAGSRFFTGVSAENTGFRSRSLFEVGIPEIHGKKMFQEMRQQGLYPSKQINEMEKRFLTGGSIGGVIARHPFIDDFSMQQIMFRRSQTSDAQIVIPELTTGVKLKGVQAEQRLTLGPLVGMAGDKDADIFSAMLVSPDNEKIIRKNILANDSDFTQRYVQHQVRYQLLKSGKPEIESLPTVQAMIGEARKLATTPEWVPRLSVQMSQAKSAIRRFGPGGTAGADAQMLLTWLEQTPISAKHQSPQQAYKGELGTMMTQLSQGFENRDISSVKEVVTNIMKGNKISEHLLKGSVELDRESINSINSAFGGNILQGNIQGPDIDKALHTVMSSMDQYRSSGALREEQLLFGRGGGIKAGEIPELIGMAEAAFKTAGKSFSNVSSAFQTATNRMGAMGNSLIKHSRPAGIGFAAMLGIGAVLSTPKELVGSGSSIIPHGKPVNGRKAGGRINPESLHPSSRTIGNPSAPNMLKLRTAIVAPRATNKNMYIKGSASKGANISSLIASTGNLSQNRSFNVNINDQRSSSNKHIIANKIA